MNRCKIFCDNQGVVQVLQQILDSGYDPFQFRSHPNVDIWSRIQQLIVSRPRNSVVVEKVKSHQDSSRALSPSEQWKALGNNAADELAKHVLETHNGTLWEQQPNWTVSQENKRLDQAFLATQFLHELSTHLFQARNSRTPQEQPEEATEEVETELRPPEHTYSCLPIEIPVSFPGKKWDARWLTLVCQYFSQIRWTSCPAPLAGEISCLEMMVDLLISYQVMTPLNKKNLKRKHGHISHLPWEHISVVNYLPSPAQAAILPPPLIY